jgi:hypothetical protein
MLLKRQTDVLMQAELSEQFGRLFVQLKDGQEEILTILKEAKTESAHMSSVKPEFASSLLTGLNFSWDRALIDERRGKACKFLWNTGEEKETGNAILYLRNRLQGLKLTVEGGKAKNVHIVDVHHELLAPVHGYLKNVTGKADALIRVNQKIIDDNAKFAWALCAVQFKKDTEELCFFQQLLELVSLSRMSRYKQGVVLLGTDLNGKWQIFYFQKSNHVVCQQYASGSVAISVLKSFITSTSARLEQLKSCEYSEGSAPRLHTITHQDLLLYSTRKTSRIWMVSAYCATKKQRILNFCIHLHRCLRKRMAHM